MKIAILGASRPHLPLYLKAREMGLETYCIAWAEGAFCKDYADHFCDISIVDKDRIAELCISENIDGIISNALEPAVPTMAYVAEKCGYNGISYEAARRAVNKKLMRMRIKSTGACPQPAFHLMKDSSEIPELFPAIVKPVDSSCSNGVTKVSCAADMKDAVERALQASSDKEILIEQYIEGREVSVESISFRGRHHILAITDKETTGAPYFVETAHHQPSCLPAGVKDKIREYTVSMLSALEIDNGASHAEFKIDADGNVYFIEVGARGGGDFISYELVRLSTGYDFVKGMIEVALGRFSEPWLSRGMYSGVYFLSQETSYIKDFIASNADRDWVVDYCIQEGELKPLRKSQDRSGYIIYQADHKIIADKNEYEK